MSLQSIRPRRALDSAMLRSARSVASHLPGSDALLLLAAAVVALSVFQLAAWLAAAELRTLVYSVAAVPLALFITAVVSGRRT
jgi:hypothetical protein